MCRKKRLFHYSLRAPWYFQLLINALGERGRHQEPAPVVMSRRNSLPPLSEMTAVQALRLYSVSGADGRLRYSGAGQGKGRKGSAGEIIPPAPPCFASRLRRPAGQGEREDYARSYGRRGSEARKAFFQCAGKRGNVLSVVFQRSGAPGRFRAARPTAANRRNLLPP